MRAIEALGPSPSDLFAGFQVGGETGVRSTAGGGWRNRTKHHGFRKCREWVRTCTYKGSDTFCVDVLGGLRYQLPLEKKCGRGEWHRIREAINVVRRTSQASGPHGRFVNGYECGEGTRDCCKCGCDVLIAKTFHLAGSVSLLYGRPGMTRMCIQSWKSNQRGSCSAIARQIVVRYTEGHHVRGTRR